MTATAERIRTTSSVRDVLTDFLRAAAAYWEADCCCAGGVKPDASGCRGCQPDHAVAARYFATLRTVDGAVDDAAAVVAFGRD